MVYDVFGFAEDHQNAAFGLGKKSTLKRNRNNGVLNRAAATTKAKTVKTVTIVINWYVLRFTPFAEQQVSLCKQNLTKKPREF